MRNSYLLGFFLALLPAAAIGHDCYMAYNHPEMGDALQAFRLSDVGWMWANYHRESFDWARENFEPDFWQVVMDPILSQTTALVAALPLAILIIASFVHKMMSGAGMASAKSDSRKGESKKGKPMKYKRK